MDTPIINSPRIHCLYRLADRSAAQSKEKLKHATKAACLANFTDLFGLASTTVFGDRLDEETRRVVHDAGARLVDVDEGSGGGNFRVALRAALDLNDDDWVYLVEDDFLHRPGALEAVMDGLNTGAEYVTLYDHPDKYVSSAAGGNPNVRDGGERTRLLCGRVCHWKITNSTVMTFACRVSQLRKDQQTILRFCGGRYTDDYRMFGALAWRRRRLISAVPGFSTHCETAFLSPFYDWASLLSSDRRPLAAPESPRMHVTSV